MKVAILGCGQISKTHVSALQEIEGVQITALCDRDEFRARDMASLAKGAKVYGDFAALLREDRPDVVHVLTPPATHAQLAIQAMEAGCHVLVEKPMALSVQEADNMIAAAHANRVKLCTNHNYLFKPSIMKARQLVESGAIGQVVHVESYYGLAGEGGSYGGAARSHWAWRLPGGVFTNFLPHIIYLQLAFLKRVEAVAGVTLVGKAEEPTSEMSVLLQGACASGVMTISMRAKPYAKFVNVYGTKGIVHADLVREICVVHKETALPRMLSKALFSLEESIQLASGTVANVVKVATGKMKNMPEMPILFRQFYDSIRDDASPPVPGEEGREMIRVMEMAWEKSPAQLSNVANAVAKSVPAGPRTDVERTIARDKLIPGKVLVTGATGYLGRHLVEALSRCGVEVAALVRDKSRASLDLERQAQVITGDLRDPAAIGAAMQGVDIVFHCAAITTNSVSWTSHLETNVLGSKAVFEAALKAGAQRVVHVSSVIVYGLDRPRHDGVIEESAPYARNQNKWAYYMRSKIEADKLAFSYWRKAGLPITVARLGILYGPGGRSIGRGLAQLGPVRLMTGGGQNSLPFTHVDNAVDGLLLAAVSPIAIGQAYNIVDEPQITLREVIKHSAAIAGEQPKLVPIPPSLLSGVAGILEMKSNFAGADVPPKLSWYVIRSACRNIRYDTRKARQQLGWQPAVTLEQGLRGIFSDVA